MARRKKRDWRDVPEIDDSAPNYPAGLRGFSHTQLTHQRGLKGSTFGAASKGRRLSPAERAEVERQLRAKGEIQ